jgi:hypothetical protein
MTEAEWLACDDPEPMLAFLRGQTGGGLLAWLGWRIRPASRHPAFGERKARLYACACCRRLEDLLLDERGLRAVIVSERFADGKASAEELLAARLGAEDALESPKWKSPLTGKVFGPNTYAGVCSWVIRAAVNAASNEPGSAIALAARAATEMAAFDRDWAIRALGAVVRANLLREVVGNPFRSIFVDPAWLSWNDATVSALACSIYDERAFDRLPILADALEDAGCDNAELLGHLRGPGPHVRGCWAVDLLLGKE